MKAWLKGGLFAFAIAAVILFFYSDYLFFDPEYDLNIFLLIISLAVLIMSGVIIEFLHYKMKLKSYKSIYFFYLISFILIALFFFIFLFKDPNLSEIGLEDFDFHAVLFLTFPLISLIFSGIFWIFDKKQLESNFMVYLSVYLSAFAIFVIMIISLLAMTAEGESSMAASIMIFLSYSVWGLSFIFLIIGLVIEKMKTKRTA